MKIEFNGRVVAGFLLGAICGAIVFGLAIVGPVGRIQRERDDAKAEAVLAQARAERLNDSARQFAQQWITAVEANGGTGSITGCIDQWDSSTCFHVNYGNGSSSALPVAVPSHPSSGPDPRLEAVVVAMYNRLHPGLGDAIKALVARSSQGN